MLDVHGPTLTANMRQWAVYMTIPSPNPTLASNASWWGSFYYFTTNRDTPPRRRVVATSHHHTPPSLKRESVGYFTNCHFGSASVRGKVGKLAADSLFHLFLTFFLIIRTAVNGTGTRTMNGQGVRDRAGEGITGADRDVTRLKFPRSAFSALERYFFCSLLYIFTLLMITYR